MYFSTLPWASILIFLPLCVCTVLIGLQRASVRIITRISLMASVLMVAISMYLTTQYMPNVPGFRWMESFRWFTLTLKGMGNLSVHYCVGIDGISLGLIILSQVVFFVAMVISRSVVYKSKSYYAVMWFLLATINGCFLAMDLFLFFLFFELMLLPMYFLIGIWGGVNRERAAIKFFLYTLAGSISILVGFIVLYLSYTEFADAGTNSITHTFRIDYLLNRANLIQDSLLDPSSKVTLWGHNIRFWTFLLLFVGFCIKLPAFPFHTWLPEAHVEAPTPVSVVLAAILLKIGAYGLIRIAYPLFPDVAISLAPWVAAMGMTSVVYAAFNALAQQDLKKMIAYSSVSHMGFVLLGLASNQSEGLAGAYFQLISHGFISAGLFTAVGVLYDKTNDRTIDNYKGIAQKMPYYTAMVVLLFFASLGLPGFSGFIAEVLVLMGSFGAENIPRWITLTTLLGLLITAGYYLWTLQRVFFGVFWVREGITRNATFTDLQVHEWVAMVTLIFFIIFLGLWPMSVLHFTQWQLVPF